MNRLLLFPVFVLLVFQSMAQSGALDATFNGTGIVERTLYRNLANETIYASVLQPDGKLLVAGSQKLFSAEEGFVARLLTNGQLDATFANNGVYLTGAINSIGGLFVPKAIALDDLGGGAFEIVLAGFAITTEQVACVVKLKQNGTHDAGFGGSGFYATAPVAFESAVFNTVQVHASTHTIIAAGTNAGGTTGDFLAVSLSAAGAVNNVTTEALSANSDQVFSSELVGDVIYLAGTSKEATAPFREFFSIVSMNVLTHAIGISSVLPLGNTVNRCNVVKVASDGKIILAGRAFNGTVIETLVYRLLSTGVPDAGNFGPNGYIGYDLSPGFSESTLAMTLDPNNDIVLGGHVIVSGGAMWWKLCRINYTTGIIDPNFYLRTIPSPPVASSRGISSIHRLTSGKYILVGEVFNTSITKTDGLFKRVNNDGSEDIQNSFWVSDAHTVFTDVAVAPDGKIWACGNIESSLISNKFEAFIARFNVNGTLDQTFVDTNPETENGIKLISGAAGGTAVYALKLLSNGKVLVAGGSKFSTDYDFFVARLDNQGESDVMFSPAQGTGYFRYDINSGDDIACDLALQSDGSIVVYGQGYVTPPVNANVYTLIRLLPNGDFDPSFRLSSSDSRYHYLSSNLNVEADVYMNVRVDANDRIVFAGSDNNMKDFFVVRLRSDGENDPTFNVAAESPAVPGVFLFDVLTGSSDFAACLELKADGKILVGGNADLNNSKNYVLIQVNEDGTHDTNFGAAADNGRVIVTRGGTIEAFTGLHVESSSGAIVASGFSGVTEASFQMTAHRFSANGILDKTFGSGGVVTFRSGQVYGSVVSGNRLFVVGRQNRDVSPYLGVLAKIKLGVGVTTITTNMVYNNINKTFGDAPFIFKPSSNSPAPITYSIFNGTCATVEPSTGRVTITCAGPDNIVTVLATQPAVRGFTAATAQATITIAKATPKIVFKNQGTVVGNAFTLQASSNSDAIPTYSQLNGESFLTVDENGLASAILKGNATVVVSYEETNKYLPATAVAEVYVYNNQVAPRAYDDEAQLIFGIETFAYIDVLANDTGYTGQIVPVLTDLDPERPGIQSVFVSPAIGTFTVESATVLFTPFQGFIGSGEITYTVKDDQGNLSMPAKIMVSVSAVNESSIPALKVTELFTPNGDGLNEAFVIGFINPDKSNRLTIFDRNGAELFSKADYRNDWEGELSNGNVLENGTYYYLFTEGSGGDQREVSGFIEIKK